MRRVWAVTLAAVLAGCGSIPTDPDPIPVPTGRWVSEPLSDGYQVVLEVGPSEVEWSDTWSCVAGEFPGPVHMDAAGRFEVEGSATAMDGSLIDRPTRLRGVVRGDRMTAELEGPARGARRSYVFVRGAAAIFPPTRPC